MNIFKPNKKNFYIISILVLTAVICLLIISTAFAKTGDAIKETANETGDAIKEKANEVLDQQSKQASQKRDEALNEALNKFLEKMDNLEYSLTKELIPKYLEQLTKKAESKIESFNTQEITQKILVILDQKVKALADDFTKTLQTAIDNLGQSIEKDKKSLMDNIAGKIDSWNKDLEKDKNQIIEKISTALDNLEQATKTAKDKMENIEDNIHVKGIVESLKTSINQLPPQLSRKIKDLIKESLPTWLGGTTPDNKNSNVDANENNPVSPAVTSNSSVGKIMSLFGSSWWNS